MQITNAEDLARFWGVEPTEKAISHAVYEYTECGAWAKLEPATKVSEEKQSWRVWILKSSKGYCAHHARKLYPSKRWRSVPRSRWPKELVEYVAFDAGLDADGFILDKGVVEFLDSLTWDARGLPTGDGPYFKAEITVATGYAPGISFGSIVEGVERNTTVHTLTFPCDSDDITKALDAIEAEAEEIWKESHGCDFCWGGDPDVESEYGERPVDPNCPECMGQGVPI